MPVTAIADLISTSRRVLSAACFTLGHVADQPASPALHQSVLVLPEARWGEEDPARRQLAESAQRAGITIRPRIEVQHANAALELAAGGVEPDAC